MTMTGSPTSASDNIKDWYFGGISREAANKILMDLPTGSYLVRDSTSALGGFVIMVKEKKRINNYLITRIDGANTIYRIGSKDFAGMEPLILYYSSTAIGDSKLVCAAPKWVNIAMFKYEAKDPNDLSVERGDLLDFIMQKEKWVWCRSQTTKRKGWLPDSYIKEYDPQRDANLRPSTTPSSICQMIKRNWDLPTDAVVVRPRNPNIYAEEHLKLEKDDEVEVKRICPDGLCEVFHKGHQREGLVPINYLNFKITTSTHV